jgi:UDP-GlcNAc3NAcA epimerase
MKIMTVVGTRPEFVQTSPVSKAIRSRHTEILVHTGQHYDDKMSNVFFEELNLPEPEINLGVGSGSHGQQTGQILAKIEEAMLVTQPDWVVVFGDTNSTVAGAMAAAKLQIPIAHIEAGLRSYDRAMPEEINRVITDHISTILFAPTQVAVDNLAKEGITQNVLLIGDVRIDLILGLVERARGRQPTLLGQIGLEGEQQFALTTIHRASNTDDPERLCAIVESLNRLDLAVVLPMHPRLVKMVETAGLKFAEHVRTIEPVGLLDMVALLDACKIVITDSGGLQKEAYMLRRPTVTVRNTTEWTETVFSGWNRLCEPDWEHFSAAINEACGPIPSEHPDFYGTVGVSERIVDVLETFVEEQIPSM